MHLLGIQGTVRKPVDPKLDDSKTFVPITPEQLKNLRKKAGCTQTEAAKLVHVSLRTWQSWETPADSANHRQMPEAHLELFCLKNDIVYPPKH